MSASGRELYDPGDASEQAGDAAGAFEAYRLSAKADPDIAAPFVGLARILSGNHQRVEAIASLCQLRRAAVSVCSNIAEGSARRSKMEKIRFYEISRSSIVEIDTQIEISLVLEYLTKNQIPELEKYLESVFRMLSKMISNLERPTNH